MGQDHGRDRNTHSIDLSDWSVWVDSAAEAVNESPLDVAGACSVLTERTNLGDERLLETVLDGSSGRLLHIWSGQMAQAPLQQKMTAQKRHLIGSEVCTLVQTKLEFVSLDLCSSTL